MKSKICTGIYFVFFILTFFFIYKGINANVNSDSSYELALLSFNIIFYTYIYNKVLFIVENKSKKKEFYVSQFSKLNDFLSKKNLIKWVCNEDRNAFLVIKRKIDLHIRLMKDMNDDFGDKYKINEDIKKIENHYQEYLRIAEEFVEASDFNARKIDFQRNIDLMEYQITNCIKKIYFNELN